MEFRISCACFRSHAVIDSVPSAVGAAYTAVPETPQEADAQGGESITSANGASTTKTIAFLAEALPESTLRSSNLTKLSGI